MIEKKARRGAGSYRKKGKNSYQLRYRGKNKTITAQNDTQAERALAAFISDVDKGKFKPATKMTVKQLSESFLRDNPDLSEATKENYRIHLDKRILPVFGDMKIDKIKPAHVYDFMNNLKEDGIREDGKQGGLSPATIQKNLYILSSMLSFAVDLKELEENPCDRVKPPKVQKRKKAGIERDLAREVLKALKEESLKYKCITLLAATTGERRGEILGIGDSTLDLDNLEIDVSRAIRHTKGRIFVKEPKTESGIRRIPFPANLVPLLQEMINARNKKREACGDLWVDMIETEDGELIKNDLLFTQWNGKPMHPNSINTWWTKFREDNNLPIDFKFHGLRHTNITQLLKAGVDLGTVSNNSGHSTKTMTLYYDGLDAKALREVASKADTIFDLENIIPDLLGKPVNIYRNKKKVN
ncbi:MAG: site-specific integrase [Syntrophomonadaceae bacterium]|nr:site-specific integrase [Syntrophomonadaceae bacterium]